MVDKYETPDGRRYFVNSLGNIVFELNEDMRRRGMVPPRPARPKNSCTKCEGKGKITCTICGGSGGY